MVQMWTVLSQIAGGVEYIHGEHQIHRDIKPGNGDAPSFAQRTDLLVLYSSKSSVWKLADFGLSSEGSSTRNLPTKYSSGTPVYRAPELMDSGGDPAMFNNKVDIWATGCILYELATGTRPFKSDVDVLCHRVFGKKLDVVLDDSFDMHSVETIEKHIVDMLQIDPSHRPSASFLSKEFERQLQLAHHNVLHSTTTDSVTLAENSEFRQEDQDQSGLVSQEDTPIDLAEENPPEVYSTKLFR